jgi:hypothetical protein
VDTRDKLGIYVKTGLLTMGDSTALPQLGIQQNGDSK